MTENQEQAAIFEWAALMERKYPELRLLFAVPNGGYRPPKTAAILKMTGVKSGVPDICLPVPRNGFGSLYIELKRRKGGAVSVNQKMWLNALKTVGNKAVICKGWEEARDEIIKYLEGA
jgi:hypothetical protein